MEKAEKETAIKDPIIGDNIIKAWVHDVYTSKEDGKLHMEVRWSITITLRNLLLLRPARPRDGVEQTRVAVEKPGVILVAARDHLRRRAVFHRGRVDPVVRFLRRRRIQGVEKGLGASFVRVASPAANHTFRKGSLLCIRMLLAEADTGL